MQRLLHMCRCDSASKQLQHPPAIALRKHRVSNCISFSPCGQYMYFCDSPTRRIYKQRYSASGSLSSSKQLVYAMPAADAGVPDGGQFENASS
jgi:sugar lactone lactonase YvrE